jgi:hypothetical protein
MPVVSIKAAIPPLALKLANLSQALSSPSTSTASMSATASLAASLPPIPIHPLLVVRLAENLTAAAQINSALGTNVASSTSTAQLRMSLQSLSTHLNMLMAPIQIPPPQLVSLLNLTSTLASIAQFQSSFGINLMAPTASAQIRAALQARLAVPAPASTMSASAAARLSAYAQLAAAAQAAGGPSNLIPSLQAMASLQLPNPSSLLMSQLSTLLTLQQMSSQIQSVLGLSPLAANLSATVRAALQPLPPLVESLTANLATTSAATSPVSATASAQISAVASMNLRALVSLRIPNLAPLKLVAQFAATFPVTSTSRCGPECPVSF